MHSYRSMLICSANCVLVLSKRSEKSVDLMQNVSDNPKNFIIRLKQGKNPVRKPKSENWRSVNCLRTIWFTIHTWMNTGKPGPKIVTTGFDAQPKQTTT